MHFRVHVLLEQSYLLVLSVVNTILEKNITNKSEQSSPYFIHLLQKRPIFDYDNCKDFVKTRNNARVVELEGSGHDTSSSQIAQDAVAEFLSKHKN